MEGEHMIIKKQETAYDINFTDKKHVLELSS